MKSRTAVLAVIAGLFLACAAAFAGDKVDVNGIITGRSGDSMTVKTGDGPKTVFLNDDTKTKDDRGLFGLDKQYMSNAVLIPGLKVEVDAKADDQGRLVATVITVDGDDLETAEMIQAGLNPTAQQVATNVDAIESNRKGITVNSSEIASSKQNIEANKQNIEAHQQKIQQNMQDIKENTERFENLTDFDVKGQATVNFEVGSSKVSAKDQQELKQLATSATGLEGYLIEVMGYADSTGSAVMNTKLSEDRAKAVTTYLVQQCGVPIRHIVAPGAMGEYGPSASNETKAGRGENRKVDVKLLLNKGLSGT